jgi:hypothetical protein
LSELKNLALFMYGDQVIREGFWYSHVLREVHGLPEEKLFWIPHPNGLCILWHIGHIAHRERTHIGLFLQGFEPDIIPEKFDVFGTEWSSVPDIRRAVGSIDEVFEWAKSVRKESRRYIASLEISDFASVPPTSDGHLSVAHWLMITAAHTALHIGRIQLLRAQTEGTRERAC